MNFTKLILDGVALWISVLWKQINRIFTSSKDSKYIKPGSHWSKSSSDVSDDNGHVLFVVVKIIPPYIPRSWLIIGFFNMSNRKDGISGAGKDYPGETLVQYSTESYSIMPSQSVT